MATAIQTEYRGALFRSRLEARWAAFFDLIGWQWTYEPFDGDMYIPDFLIHGRRELLVEVKPDMSGEGLERHAERVTQSLAGHWSKDILILGGSPVCIDASSHADATSAGPGVLLEYFNNQFDMPEWVPSAALWAACAGCGRLAVFHPIMSFQCRPCSCYDGDRFITYVAERRPSHSDHDLLRQIENLWNAAHRVTRWVPS